ncbi:hypothetical protein DsansV1_C02g0014521 [Dioscorea sansibarensis]
MRAKDVFWPRRFSLCIYQNHFLLRDARLLSNYHCSSFRHVIERPFLWKSMEEGT